MPGEQHEWLSRTNWLGRQYHLSTSWWNLRLQNMFCRQVWVRHRRTVMAKEAILVKSALEHRMVAEKGFQARMQQVYKIRAWLALVVPAVHLYFVLSRWSRLLFLGGMMLPGIIIMLCCYIMFMLSSVIMSYGGQLVSWWVGSWSCDDCVAPLRVLYIVYRFFEVGSC